MQFDGGGKCANATIGKSNKQNDIPPSLMAALVTEADLARRSG